MTLASIAMLALAVMTVAAVVAVESGGGDWASKRPTAEEVLAGVFGSLWGILLSFVEYKASRESIEADYFTGNATEAAGAIKARGATERFRLIVRGTTGVLVVVGTIYLIGPVHRPELKSLAAIGSGTILEGLLSEPTSSQCEEVVLQYLDVGSEPAVPILSKRVAFRHDMRGIALMSTRYESSTSGEETFGPVELVEILLGEDRLVPIVNANNKCSVVSLSAVRELAKGGAFKWTEVNGSCLQKVERDKGEAHFHLPVDCARSGTCVEVGHLFGLGKGDLRASPQQALWVRETVDLVAGDNNGLGVVSELLLKQNPLNYRVRELQLTDDRNGTDPDRGKRGLWAYAPLRGRDEEKYSIADRDLVRCVLENYSAKPGAFSEADSASQDEWRRRRHEQGAWLATEHTFGQMNSNYRRDPPGQGRPAVWRLKCESFGGKFCRPYLAGTNGTATH